MTYTVFSKSLDRIVAIVDTPAEAKAQIAILPQDRYCPQLAAPWDIAL